MQNKKRRGQQEQLQMPVSGELAKSKYEKSGTVRDESIFCIERKCQKSDKKDWQDGYFVLIFVSRN